MKVPFARHSAADRARQARGWAVRLDRGDLGPLGRVRLRRWLSEDANVRALAQAQAFWTGLDAAVAETRTLPSGQALRRWRSPRPSRRASLDRSLAGALAAAAVVGVLILPGLATRVQADARTGIGEQRELILDDGSRVLLNTASAVDVRYSSDARTVRLLQGEARFEVAADRKRPFVVEAAGGRVTALGTIFTVRRRGLGDGGGAVASAVEHAVGVLALGEAATLNPGQSAHWGFGRAPSPVRLTADPNLTGWSSGGLSFESRPLGEVAKELDRYVPERIVVLGSARELAVSGVVPTRAPLAALHALAGGRHIILSRAPGVIIVRARAAKEIRSVDLLISERAAS